MENLSPEGFNHFKGKLQKLVFGLLEFSLNPPNLKTYLKSALYKCLFISGDFIEKLSVEFVHFSG